MELRTNDYQASKTFYEQSFGWTAIATGSYVRFQDSSSEWRAGLVHVASITTPTWIGYIWVDEPDSIVTNATALGATVVAQGQGHPLKGDWAILRDPDGGVYGVYDGNPFV